MSKKDESARAMYKAMFDEMQDKLIEDIITYGSAFIVLNEEGARRIDPLDLKKEAEEYSRLFRTN